MIQPLEYFYDRQQPRFLEQIIRAFSGIQYMTGASGGNPPVLKMVPCRMAVTNTVVASILKNQSSNTLLTVPMITIFQTGISGRPEALQNRAHIDTRQVVERAIDPDTNEYTSARGQSYTVERLMPLPFTMAIQVDIWTSNLDQKYQIEEQLLTLMWPNFTIQNSENALDWTAMTDINFESISHSSRTIPIGSTEEIDIMSFSLTLPMWLSPPAKVKQQNLIEQVVANISDTSALPGVITDGAVGTRMSQTVVTPGDHHVKIEGTVDGAIVTLLGPEGALHDDEHNIYNWRTLMDYYGFLRPAASQLALNTADIQGPSIMGTLQYDPNNVNQLFWSIDPDTLPSNTLAPVDAVIDPMRSIPAVPGDLNIHENALPVPVEGCRYLIMADIGPSNAWGDLNAKFGDIIQYHNGAWSVVFTAVGSTIQYVLNLHTNKQLRFNGDDWVMAIDGSYGPGHWRLRL